MYFMVNQNTFRGSNSTIFIWSRFQITIGFNSERKKSFPLKVDTILKGLLRPEEENLKAYHIYLAIRQGFPLSRMTSNN